MSEQILGLASRIAQLNDTIEQAAKTKEYLEKDLLREIRRTVPNPRSPMLAGTIIIQFEIDEDDEDECEIWVGRGTLLQSAMANSQP